MEEQLGFEPEGKGQHHFLFIEKTNLNTVEVARALARFARVPERDVGYCGMKDRRAVTRQWFSVCLPELSEPDWNQLSNESMRLLQATRHQRKLRRGVHRGNHFSLRIRSLAGERDELESRLQAVCSQGVPNYFGAQRFGRDGTNIDRVLEWMRGDAKKPGRHQRGILLSSLRALLFNQLLDARIEQGTWAVPQVGDLCRLKGSNSQFMVESVDEETLVRAADGDIDPALPLWGKGTPECSARVWEGYKAQLAGQLAECEFLERQGLRLDWRSTRLFPDDFCWQFCEDAVLELRFSLPAGGFATSVVRELLNAEEQYRAENNMIGSD